MDPEKSKTADPPERETARMARPFLPMFSTLTTAIVIVSANASLDNKVGPVMEEIVIDVDPAEGEEGNVLEEERSQRDLNNIVMGEEYAGRNPADNRIREFHILKRADPGEGPANGRIRILKKRDDFNMDGKIRILKKRDGHSRNGRVRILKRNDDYNMDGRIRILKKSDDYNMDGRVRILKRSEYDMRLLRRILVLQSLDTMLNTFDKRGRNSDGRIRILKRSDESQRNFDGQDTMGLLETEADAIRGVEKAIGRLLGLLEGQRSYDQVSKEVDLDKRADDDYNPGGRIRILKKAENEKPEKLKEESRMLKRANTDPFDGRVRILK